jgi:exodeoxyribonuclease VII small subunit
MAETTKKAPKSFEEAIQRLEDIVEQLESPELPLEKSIELFEEGMKLSQFCNAKLNEAEKKITQLVKKPAGKVEEVPFEGDSPSSNDDNDDQASSSNQEEIPF